MSASSVLKMAGSGIKVAERWGSKNLPTILTAVATAGVVGGSVLAVKQTPGFRKELEEAAAEWNAIADKEKRNVWDYRLKLVRIGVKWYWQVVAVDTLAIVCMWEANRINLKRLGVALAGCKYFSDKVEDLEKQVLKDEGGEKKLQKYRDSIAQEKFEKAEFDSENVFGIGEHLCFEPIGDHVFLSNIETIRRAVGEIEDELYEQLADGADNYAFVPLNDLFRKIGAPTNADFGNTMGFLVELSSNDISPKELRRKVHEAVDIGFGSVVKNGTPALSLEYHANPRYNYYEY